MLGNVTTGNTSSNFCLSADVSSSKSMSKNHVPSVQNGCGSELLGDFTNISNQLGIALDKWQRYDSSATAQDKSITFTRSCFYVESTENSFKHTLKR